MKIRVTSRFSVSGTGNLDSMTDRLMVSLVDLENAERDISEADVSATLGQRLVEISVVVSAESWGSAEKRALTVVERAIRSVGGEPSADMKDADTSTGIPTSVQSVELVPA